MFDEFWSYYPNKKGKADARKAFKKFEGNRIIVDKMINAIGEQKRLRQWQDRQYIPFPATWLRAERWEDEFDDRDFVSLTEFMEVDDAF